MSFNPSIPQISDFLAISQKQLLANFQQISNSFSQNHIGLSLDNQGMHTSLTMRAQTGDPATAANQCALYSKVVAGTTQMFFRPSSNQPPIQMTNSNSSIFTGGQSTFLAGPFTIYVGFQQNIPDGTVITLTPVTTLIYVGIGTTLNGGNIPNRRNIAIATNVTGNQFTVKFENGIIPDPTIYYFAIGST